MFCWIRLVVALAVLSPTTPAAPSAFSRSHDRHHFLPSSSSSSQHEGSTHDDVSVGWHDASDTGGVGHQWRPTSVVPSSPVSLDQDGSAGINSVIGDQAASHSLAGVIPAWLKQSSTVGALTPSHDPTAGHGDSVVEGIVVPIAPRFMLTSLQLLTARGWELVTNGTIGSQAVVFNGDTVKVKNVQLEADFNKNTSQFLVVLELERELKSSAGRPLSIVTSKPKTDFEFEKLSILDVSSVLSPTIPRANKVQTLRSKLTFFVEPMCGYSVAERGPTDTQSEVCVGQLNQTAPNASFLPDAYWKRPAPWNGSYDHDDSHDPDRRHDRRLDTSREENNNRHGEWRASVNNHTAASARNNHVGIDGGVSTTPLQVQTAALLLYENELVGLSLPNKLPTGQWMALTKGPRQGFIRLAATKHRDFLDHATGNSITYDDDDVFNKLSKYPSYLATFVDSSDQKLACQAVLIAPKFVLTTASCVDAQPTVHGMMFYDSDASRRQIIKIIPTHVAKHSRYTPGDATFDTAVMELETAVTLAPIKLDDGSATTNSSFARLQVSENDECVLSATSWNPNVACRNSKGNAYKPSDAICGMPAPTEGSKFSVKDFVGDPSIARIDEQSSAAAGAALIKVCEVANIALVGLSVTASSKSGRALAETTEEVYVRVSNSATFINAYVSRTSWSISPTRMADLTVVSAEMPSDLQFVVGLRTTQDGQNFCGGSLVAPTTVLTAAHCVVDGPVSFVSIGGYQSSGDVGEVIPIVKNKTKTHTLYGQPHQFSYDVAILELQYPSAVAPVVLDDTSDFLQRELATMYGYGMESATSGLSTTIRAVTVPLWSEAACASVYGNEVDDSMLCAGGEKGKDACTGDSGSPLVESRNGQYVLVGVVSAGTSCGLENVPGVYARVSHVKGFLESRTIGATWATVATETPASGGGGGSTSTSTSTGTTTLPTNTQANVSEIEAREATDVSSSAPSVAPDTTPDDTSDYNEASLMLSSLSPLMQESLMDFLLGSDAETLMSSTMKSALTSSANQLRFYSTSDLTAIMAIIQRHNSSALNSRRDRFGRWQDAYADTVAGSRSNAYCV